MNTSFDSKLFLISHFEFIHKRIHKLILFELIVFFIYLLFLF